MRYFGPILYYVTAFIVVLVNGAHAQNTLFPGNPGDMIVHGTTPQGWVSVPGSTAGCVLTSQGPTAAPTWQCALALNFQLPPMATNKIWGNVSGTQAPATQIDVSDFLNTLDYDITRPPVPGATVYKGTDNKWHSAPPAQTGYVWTTQGNGQIPQWTLPGSGITVGAATLKGNPTGVPASAQDFTIQGLVQKIAPAANTDLLLVYDAVTGTFKKATPGSIAASATAGVSLLNGLTGSLTLGALTVTATGASTAISEASRAARQIYVTDFGALCDGTTNDQAAFQAAIDAMTASGGYVYVPTGTCAFASGFVLPSGVTLAGQGTGQNNYPYTTRLKWTGGATGAMISTAIADTASIVIKDLVIDGNVVVGDLATSALKGILVHNTTNMLIQNVVIQNIGKGISFEPDLTTNPGGLIRDCTFRDIYLTFVGTGMDFTPNYVFGDETGGTTNNMFYNTTIFEYTVYGLNFVGLADDNKFDGMFIANDYPGAGAAIIFNSGSPSNFAGVYSNTMLNAEIGCLDDAHASVVVNNSQFFGSLFQGALFNCAPVQINTGGAIDVQDTNSAYSYRSSRTVDATTGMAIKNQNNGASSATVFDFGNDSNDALLRIQANSATNAALGGANSVNFANAGNAPTNFYIGGALHHSITDTGNELIGLLTLSNSIGNANGTNPLCYNSGTGAVTYATTACTASDAALKRDFVPIKDALSLIKDIDGGYFYWKDAGRGEGRQIGLLANNAEKSLPELVSKDDTGMRGFDYQHFTAVLLSAVKELKAENDSLRVCQQSWTCRVLGWSRTKRDAR